MISGRTSGCGAFIVWTALLASPAAWAQTHEETSLWDSVKDSKDAEDYKAYLDKYPDGVYAPIAKRRVASLEAAHPAASAPADPDTTPPYPSVMHFCAAHCYTWNFANGQSGNGQSTISISRWSPDSVVLNRSDAPNPGSPRGLKAVITGQMSPAHDKLVNGKITWTFGQGGTYDCKVTWGDALNDIPGTDVAPAPPVVSAAPANQAPPDNDKPSESSKSLPTDEASNAEIDAGFRRWSAGWMFDRYVPGSARATERALKQDTYVIRGMFDFIRGGGKLTIPYAASYSKADDHYQLSNLCYNDTSTGMTDCVNPSNPGPMQNRQFLGSIVLLGMVAAMASDQTCVRRYTFFGSSYLECYD
jgi:hypothetical protein